MKPDPSSSCLRLLCLGLLAAAPLAPAFAQEDAQLAKIESFFADATILAGPEVVDCTLSGGTQTRCVSLTVTDDPARREAGPWCPQSISDGPENGGIWIVEGEVVDVDGNFITRLADIYGDTNWQLFDPDTGAVRFTGTLEACEAAARPDVDPKYQNNCVQCLPEYMPDDAAMTYVIPLIPVMMDMPGDTRLSGSGLAYDGVRLDAPAPVDAILSAYTIAPFDDCGGHVNTNVGYHYHAVTDCLEAAPAATIELAGHGPQVGLAMDGHAILTRLMTDGSEPTDLDACGGHVGDNGTYHYHAGAPGENAILGCLVGEVGCVLNDAGVCDASANTGRRGNGPPPPRND